MTTRIPSAGQTVEILAADSYDTSIHWDAESVAYGQMPPAHALPPPDPCPTPVVHHYSDSYHLPNLLQRGRIPVWAEDNMPRICAVSWFSVNPVFDTASVAAYALRLTGAEGLHAFTRPGEVRDAVRIVVSPECAPYRWFSYSLWCGVWGVFLAHRAELESDENGSDFQDWRVNPFPVDASQWVGVEIWDADALTWMPIADSQDRMVRELLPMLPSHLRGPGTIRNGLASDVRCSPWSLPQITDTPSEPSVCDDDPPCCSPVTDERIEEFMFARGRWICANEFARMGFAVFPVDEHGHALGSPAAPAAPSASDWIDRQWLMEHPKSRLAMALGTASGGVFALRLRGWHRRRSLTRDRTFPATVSLRVWNRERDEVETVLLYRAPPDMVVPSFRLAKTPCGGMDIVGENERLVGPGVYVKASVSWSEGPTAPVPAPAWLLEKIRRSGNGGDCRERG